MLARYRRLRKVARRHRLADLVPQFTAMTDYRRGRLREILAAEAASWPAWTDSVRFTTTDHEPSSSDRAWWDRQTRQDEPAPVDGLGLPA
jgi:hypothetical protein